MLFLALWAYRTSMEIATGFTPFQSVYGLEATLSIECETPSLNLAMELLPNTSPEEEHLLYLERLDETRRFAALVIKAQKIRSKLILTNQFPLIISLKEISSSCTIKIMITWGQVNFNPCGMDLTLLNVYCRMGAMSSLITKVIL